MPDENQNNLPPEVNSGFVKKTVETPILDSDLRAHMNEVHEPGFIGFYKANKFYFWAILFGLVIIGVLAFFAFRPGQAPAPKPANIEISTEVPPNIASGGEAVYAITVKNNDSQKLVGVELELAYPEGMNYEDSQPKANNLSGTVFPVPDLVPGQNATLFIKTRVNGNINDEKKLGIKLLYNFSNFNSQFSKESSVTIKLIASDVVMQIAGPDITNNAQLVQYVLSYQNNSNKDIQNARIKLHFPSGFTYAQADPKPDLGSDTWNIGQVAKNASSTIIIQGSYTSAGPGEVKTISADFLILANDGSYFTQNTATINTSISSLPLLVTQELYADNGSGVINPGDNLRFNLNYQNNGTTAATGVNIRVDLDSKVLDLASIRAEGGVINNNSISWNAAGVSKLASLSPNQGGQLSFSVKVNNPAVKDSSKNLTVVSNIEIRSNEYSTPLPGNKLNLKVSSPSSMSSTLNFVSGALPPEVGQSTTYKVTLSLTNSTNDFSGGVLTAFIPLGSGAFDVASVNSAEAQSTQYDPSTGKLTWNFSGLPANTGRFSQPKSLSFNVTLNPSASQANQQVTLIKDINYTATDNFTQSQAKGSVKNITTADLSGEGGYSNGTVRP